MKLTVPSKKLGFLVYENSESPKYFELKKSYFKFLLMGLPTLSFISVIALILCGLYFKQIREMARRKEPAIIKELRDERDQLSFKLKESENLSLTLQNKLASGAPSDNQISTLDLFKMTPGMQDLSAEALFTVENIEAYPVGNKLQFQFNIVNQTKENKKIAGYIFVMMKEGDLIRFYPQGSTMEDNFQVSFNRGESFATSRFRPVQNIFFPAPKKNGNLLFKIIIFSRTGDLLYKSIMKKNWKI